MHNSSLMFYTKSSSLVPLQQVVDNASSLYGLLPGLLYKVGRLFGAIWLLLREHRKESPLLLSSINGRSSRWSQRFKEKIN